MTTTHKEFDESSLQGHPLHRDLTLSSVMTPWTCSHYSLEYIIPLSGTQAIFIHPTRMVSYYCPLMECEGPVFSNVCLSLCTQMGDVTITYDALDLTL